MLNTVEVRTTGGELLSMPLQDISAGFLIKEITGLDPVKATIVSSSFAQLDGSVFQSVRREDRNIIIKLGLIPDPSTTTVEALRKALYAYFMPKSTVSLRFYMQGSDPIDIVGMVESFETPLFSKEPEVAISIKCFDPDLFDPTAIVVSGSTTSGTTETTINYEGTVETGVLFNLAVNRTIGTFVIYARSPDDVLRNLEFTASLINLDSLTIGTVPGDKKAILTRSGIATSVLYGISPYSAWITLYPGVNTIRVYAVGAAIPYTLTYTKKFGGL